MKISIEANISAGKTTLLTNIQQTTRIPVFLEPIHEWTLLDRFYSDTTRWGFAFNTEVLYSMSKWKNNNFLSIYERTPMSCRWVFTELQYQDGKMTKEELDLFDKLYKEFSWEQDVLIYIKTDPEICYKRMQERARGCEVGVTLEYLQKLDRMHENMIDYVQKHKPHIKVYGVNGNFGKEEVYRDVLSIINMYQ